MNERDLIEALATLEHDRWAHWQKYLHSRCKRLPDGSLVLPADLVSRWDRQIELGYEELSDEEKESDREQVKRALPLIRKFAAHKQG